MKGESVMYEGRQVPKEGFRAFVYGLNNQRKLTNSWKDYLSHIETGIWVSNMEDLNKLMSEIVPAEVKRKKGAK